MFTDCVRCICLIDIRWCTVICLNLPWNVVLHWFGNCPKVTEIIFRLPLSPKTDIIFIIRGYHVFWSSNWLWYIQLVNYQNSLVIIPLRMTLKQIRFYLIKVQNPISNSNIKKMNEWGHVDISASGTRMKQLYEGY